MLGVSVIMPVYNAEKYLGEAIDSVLNQTYPDFELLLINDRSTDRSKEICLEYQKRDSRIVVLENNSENHGPGPTRNIGLDYATGDYIYFMDADDWIDHCLLQSAVHRMEETNSDLVQFGVVYEGMDGSNPDCYVWRGKGLLTKDEIKENFSEFWTENRNSLWMYLFRREKIKAIQFENIIIGEDISFTIDVLSKAEKIAYIPKALYHYRYVKGSTSHRWVENTVECREILWRHQLHYLKSFQGELDPLVYAQVAYDNYVWVIYLMSSNLCTLTYGEKKRELMKIRKTMEFDQYRKIYPLEWKHGFDKIKYMLIKYRLENILLLFGPVFLKLVRGE